MMPGLLNPFAFGVKYAQAMVQKGVTVYWKMDEAAGTTAVDSSGGGHDGTHSGTGVTVNQSALLANGDKSYSFNGTTGVVTTPDGAYLDAQTALSILCWIKTSATGTRSMWDRDGGVSNRGWQFRMNGGDLQFVKIGGTGASGTFSAGHTGNNNGAVHMLGITFDGSNIRFYKDGVKTTTTACVGAFVANVDSALRFGANASPGLNAFYSGQAGHAGYFAGKVLTDADFSELYTIGVTP